MPGICCLLSYYWGVRISDKYCKTIKNYNKILPEEVHIFHQKHSNSVVNTYLVKIS